MGENDSLFPLTYHTTHQNLTKCHYTLINESEENSPPSLLFMTLLYFTSMERLFSPAHATNQDHPDDNLVSNSCNLSYIYMILEVSIENFKPKTYYTIPPFG